MKLSIATLTVLFALVVGPAGVFAKDSDKDKEKKKRQELAQKEARREADRRANGYYDTPIYRTNREEWRRPDGRPRR
jgi:hypothetical protein